MEFGSSNMELKRPHQVLTALENVVRSVGQQIAEYRGPVYDTRPDKNESSIDNLAYQWALGAIEKHFSAFQGKIYFEKDTIQIGNPRKNQWILRIDELDGTTNAKRAIAAAKKYLPRSAVSVALCRNEGMDSIEMGAVYHISEKTTFAAKRDRDEYIAFENGTYMDPEKFSAKKADTHNRVMVVGYFNTCRTNLGELQQAVADAGFYPYEGSRSSTIDILDITSFNHSEAYVDARALWPKRYGAQLQSYDVAGVIPIAKGIGLEVSDVYGKPLNGNGVKPVSLIVARPGLTERIVKAIRPVLDRQRKEK